MSLPLAIVTVEFDAGVTGEGLAALVQQVTHNSGGTFVFKKRYYDGDIFELGHSLDHSYSDIRVVPDLEDTFFRPHNTYLRVKVTSHTWGGSRYGVSPGDDIVIELVKNFAAALKEAFEIAMEQSSFPIFHKPQS